ncbi:MAG: FHA domain-containing protein, partial [Coriobacteriales bacterium]|nr:FHA domain-containing protein [Coriobacteriales bacterium]
MIITLIRNDRLFTTNLPNEIAGKHWLYDTDAQGNRRQLASIEAVSGSWIIVPHGQVSLISLQGGKVASAPLEVGKGLYHLKLAEEPLIALLTEEPQQQDKVFSKLGLTADADVSIGRSGNNSLVLSGEYVSSQHALLRYRKHRFYIVDLNSSNGVFVNNRAIAKQKAIPLRVGDVVFILGLKLTVGSNFFAFNNPGGRLSVNTQQFFVPYQPQPQPTHAHARYNERQPQYFFRSPRIRRDINEAAFTVEDPPAPVVAEEAPLLLRIGPSIGMALASCFMGLYMVMNMMGGSGDMLRMIPMLAMMLMMVAGAVVWPSLSARHTKKKNDEKERLRIQQYANYLDNIRSNIQHEIAEQKQILLQNRISVAECFSRVGSRARSIYERTPVQKDFLSLRVGTGDIPLAASFRWPQDKLGNQGDVLRGEVLRLAREPQILRGAPLALSLLNDHVAGIVGRRHDAYPFIRGLLVQLLALHAPGEVKLVVLCKEDERREWEFLFRLPHIFDDSYSMRYLACNLDEATEITMRLERELQKRLDERAEVVGDYGAFYVLLSLDSELSKRVDFVSRVSALRENKGFAILAYARDIRNLPKECTRIVEVNTLHNSAGTLFSQMYDPNDHSGAKQPFIADIAVDKIDANVFARALAAVELPASDSIKEITRSLGFLEMFEAAKVEHLNVHTRWHDNNPCVSLATPVGVDASGMPFILNIHEDYHGPHGLIAGMTGSGKSEFIIAWILSLAVNYRPDEVSFVLIDYKGGGLVGAFCNDKIRLPHLAGTITNLDGGAIQRSLVSINSELKRRQNDFNIARERAGLGTMDIYRYQELYRSGIVEKPIPHLLIVSDEFAELKDQQPEFMDELVKTARIGRSLGVHLILATQKPSGVVNEQIWSNARFKVCLKVADASDSREMLKVTDAAELVDPGRFYLLVGYNEYFALGQSAYAGTNYIPRDQIEKAKDSQLTLVSNTGRSLLSIKPQKRGSVSHSQQPESLAVLEHLVEVAQSENLLAPAL